MERNFFVVGYKWLIRVAGWLQHPFLLIIRLYWGYEFLTSGWGKLGHIEKVTGYFTSLHIPFPQLNAYLAGCSEFFGGICLLLGLASRITTVPLIFTMIIAYATDGSDTLKQLLSDPDKFTGYTAFPFLLVSIIVFLFGPGVFSIDGLIAFLASRKATADVRQ